MNVMAKLPVLGQDQDVAFSFWAKDISEGKLLVTAFAVDETIFGMTRIEVMLTSHDRAINLQSIIDNTATLTIHHKYLDTLRHFSGIVVEAEIGDEGHHRTAYRVVLLPTLCRLDHGSDCRIFQGSSVPDIVRTIFTEHDIQDVEWQLQDNHFAREYCVQYRETHLGFVERILAEEGIFYYFKHDKQGKHTLVLTDAPDNLPDCPGQKELEYNANASTMVKGVYCSSLSYREKLRSTTFIQRDYSFKNPGYSQEQKDSTSNRTGEKGDYEMYDYPGRYKQDAMGKAFTRYKLEATRVDAAIAHGVANAPLLLTGHGFALQEHSDKQLNQKWRLLTIRHEGVQPQAFGEDGQGNALGTTGIVAPGINGTTLAGLSFGVTGSKSPGLLNSVLSRGLGLGIVSSESGATSNACVYSCAFSAQPARLPYRPPQTAKPLVDGPQVAIVVGPPGEQIHTDEHGRVKIHFPWDRHKAADAEDSSCWVRVSQGWGGGSFGNISIPRIGHEVIVEFLEGDPDQPIIMGRTYHANNKTPYQLPAHKTKMAIRSDTHKGDGGFNELSFEDEKGQENMFMHAERDQTIKVRNNQTQRVDANAVQTIGKNQAIEVGKNVNHHVGGGMNMVVGAVGTAAMGIIGNVLTNLMGQSATLLQQGMAMAARAMQGKDNAKSRSSPAENDTEPESARSNSLDNTAVDEKTTASIAPQSGQMARETITAQNAAAAKSGVQPMMSFAPKPPTSLETPAPVPPPTAPVVSPNPAPTANVTEFSAGAPVITMANPLSDDATAITTETNLFSKILATGGAVSGLSAAAKGLEQARGGINAASQYLLRTSGGASMADAGDNLAQNIESLIGGGVLNELISKFHNTTTGIAATEQVGQVKVTTVGQVSMEHVGHTKQIEIGEKFIIAVGKDEETGEPMSTMIMDSEGKVTIRGKDFEFIATNLVKVEADRIDLNEEDED